MKIAAIAVALLFSSACVAAPNKSAADKWVMDFHAAKSKSFDALTLKDPTKRRTNAQEIIKLRDRAEKIFGSADECYMSASGLVDVYQDAIQLQTGGGNAHIVATGMARKAWESGQIQAVCESKIDALK